VSERLDRFGRPVGEGILHVTEAIIEAEQAKLKVEMFEGGERMAECAKWLVPELSEFSDTDIIGWLTDETPSAGRLNDLMVEAGVAALANIASLLTSTVEVIDGTAD
jgi:hypothetical protein